MSDSDRITRRGFLRATLASGAAVAGAGPATNARGNGPQTPVDALEPAKLRRLVDVLLPAELSDSDRDVAVRNFLAWLSGYRADAEMDHGYGFTREAHTAPSPAVGYAEDLRRLEQAAGGDLMDVASDQLPDLVRTAIEAAMPEGRNEIPARPDDTHLCIGLLSSYYRGAAATDRCYGVVIGRETCRGLFTDVDSLQPFSERSS